MKADPMDESFPLPDITRQPWPIQPTTLLLSGPDMVTPELAGSLRDLGLRVLGSASLEGRLAWQEGPPLDLAIIDGAGLPGAALAAQLDAALPHFAAAGIAVIALLEPEQLDYAAHGVIGAGGQVLCAPAIGELRHAVAHALDRNRATLHDSGGTRARDLSFVHAEVERLAATLRDFVRPVAAAGEPAQPVVVLEAPTVRALIRARRLRDRFFEAKLFADPAWDILLDLYAAHLERGEVSVSSLCYASATPPSTGLRWITVMTEAGLLDRLADPRDKRRQLICLTAPAIAAMDAYFACVLGAKDKRLVI